MLWGILGGNMDKIDDDLGRLDRETMVRDVRSIDRWSSEVGAVVGRPGPEPGRDDSGGHGQHRPEEEEDHGDGRLVVVVDEIVFDAGVVPPHVVDVPQGVVGGAEPRADAAGQQNGDHLRHTCLHYRIYTCTRVHDMTTLYCIPRRRTG